MGNVRYILSDKPQKTATGQLLYVTNSVYEGEWPSIPHTHFFSEFFFVVEGRGKFIIEDSEYDVKKDDMVIINPNILHTEKSLLNEPLDYFVLGIRGIRLDFCEGNKNYGIYNIGKHREELIFWLKKIMAELDKKEENHATIAQNIWEIFFVTLARATGYMSMAIEDEKVPKDCSKVKRYIDFCYADNITLDTLAEKTHLNKFYLVHIFTKTYGVSPINYLISRRIETGKELLSSTDLSISQIAQSCGFSSQSYFSQSFKKLEGISPNQYRKNVKD